MIQLINGDCLTEMAKIPAGSVDMVLVDPPYGTTQCKWDSIIPLQEMWGEINRLAKKDAAILIMGSQPFASSLVMSNPKNFKYEIVYEKTNAKGFLSAKKRPLTAHENIYFFSNGKPTYNPQKWTVPEYLRTKRKHATSHTSGEVYGARQIVRWDDDGSRYPTSVVGFSNRVGRTENYHPTQKPVALMKYLIETYSNEGDTVLDFTMGSGTTGVACNETGRDFIGIELDEQYFNIAKQRINFEAQETAA
ncbi:site-specific DNA-methyltransferase [uncultured Methylophaga sp.]|uniref:DNA-methyltransferase n=1 Tax=uncultured Methylophaga sp. TaxID=285271 RepID=UPI0030FA93F9